MSDVSVTDAPEQSRYEARLDDRLAGIAAYRQHDGIIEFTHTEVADEYEGHGVGSALARAALDDVRRQGGRSVRPTCPFIREWIDRHPDYQDLLAS